MEDDTDLEAQRWCWSIRTSPMASAFNQEQHDW